MSRIAKLDSTLAALVLALAAWAVLAAAVLTALAPLGALMSPGPARDASGARVVVQACTAATRC
jgi:hypothetical protein